MKKFALLLMGAVALSMASCDKKEAAPAVDDQQDLITATRGFYLWRCGTPVAGDYNGNHYCTEACHLDDAYGDYIGYPGQKFDGTGGWHDAGDYGKYTLNAAFTLGHLFNAWDHFKSNLEGLDLGIPETAPAFPDFLEEMKYETDYLLKMQYPDSTGRVSHKLTRLNFSGFIMPQDDNEANDSIAARRYFTPWSSGATAEFAAAMAQAARAYAPYDSAYAQLCLDAALRSYKYLTENPENVVFEQGDFRTGDYQTLTDDDDRLWMAAEIWETTGCPDALAEVEARIKARGEAHGDTLVMDNWDWREVSNLGVWRYALSQREGRDPELVKKVNDAVQADAKLIADRINADQYGSPLAEYFWGCNGLAARNAMNLYIAQLLGGPDYSKEIRKIKDYLTGNNYYGRSFVTGIGVNPPMHPHDRRCAADGIDEPWPGYLVGGGHTPTDWVDEEADYSRNEIAINWQAGLVYLFAAALAQQN